MKRFLNGIRSCVFGLEDGLVSISGLVLGVSAGTMDANTVILAGIVGAVPAALSMAAGDYLSSKSKRELQEKSVSDTRKLVKQKKQQALDALRRHYAHEGLHKTEIDLVLRHLSKNEKLLMRRLQEVHGFVQEQFEFPMMNAAVMFSSFIIAAFFIVLPFFVFPMQQAQLVTFVTTIAGLFFVGALKTRWTGKNWLVSGLEMLAVGGGVAVVGYALGTLF